MDMVENMSIDRYLAACTRIEETAAAIYRHWGNNWQEEPCLGLWRQMEEEELDHARQIELLRRLVRGTDIARRSLNDNDVRAMIEYSGDCLARIRTCTMPIRSALAMAIRLEERFEQFHATSVVIFDDARAEKLFRNLSRSDDTHFRRLQDIYRDLPGADTLLVACQ